MDNNLALYENMYQESIEELSTLSLQLNEEQLEKLLEREIASDFKKSKSNLDGRAVFDMRLRELLTVIDSQITLELTGIMRKYKNIIDISDEFLNCEVKKVSVKDNRLLIKLSEPKKVPTLEELGYSFEAGM